MTVNYTTLLGLAKPVSGTESGTWGDTVNTNLTDYLDSAVAGTQIISGSLTAVTLSKTTGASLSQAGTGATGSSQYQIIRCTGNPASLLTITAPAADKTYVVINATSTSQSVKIVGAGPTTGVTILSGKTSIVSWNGSDFVEISPSTATTATSATTAATATNLASGSAGTIPYQSASGTTAMLAAGTSGQVLTSAGAAAPTWSTPAAATKTISNKTGAYTVVAGDLGKIINCTSGTFTVSLTAAATLGSGFTCTIWNTGTGAITIDPNASETIDGIATLILRQGEGLAVVCNGTNWETDDKKPMRGYAENISSANARPIASAAASIAISSATASGIASVAIGYIATASSNYSFALGNNSAGSGGGSQAVTGSGAMALGGSYASGVDSFAAAVTNNTSSYGATGANSIAIGQYAVVSGNSSESIGALANASGTYAFAAGGRNATASGTYSTAIGSYTTASSICSSAIGCNSTGGSAGGSQAFTGAGAMALGGSYASGADSFAAAIGNNTSSYGATGANSIAMGVQSIASSEGAITIGNNYYGGNLASARGAMALGVGGATASGFASVAIGCSTASQLGKYAFSSSRFSSNGDAQYGLIVLRAQSGASTSNTLTSDGGTASSSNQLTLVPNQGMAVTGTLIGKQAGAGGAGIACYEVKASFSNNNGTMTLNSGTLTLIGTDTVGLSFAPTISVNNTTKSLNITSGRNNSSTMYWVCTLHSTECVW
jgi:hypothetical protein